tara:strand:- start:10602 stop:11351 length:750 start_codon:yes stop_codon:yes gene_type:complete
MIKSYLYKDFRIEILYEDSDIAILNKPSGLLTHKKNNFDNSPSLQESLKDQFTIFDNENLKEGIVHRLDKDTSGVIIITKNLTSKNRFQEMFKNRNIKKNYLTFTYGILNKNNLEINKNISRNKLQRTKFNVSDNFGKKAITKVSNIKTFHGSISLLDCEIITGRTHQIRVHLLSLGLPIIGDKYYSLNKEQKFRLNNMNDNIRNLVLSFPRQALHSHKIEFDHPIIDKHIKITCDLPNDMKDLNINLQ